MIRWFKPLHVSAIAFLTVSIATMMPALAQSEASWTQLSLSTCRVDKFLRDRPQSDGRGVIIAVLDTGVDPSIPGLTQLPSGEVKVIDVQDFTGQGDVELRRVRRDTEQGTIVHYDEDGSPIHYEHPELPNGGDEERLYWLGFLEEKRFVNSSVPDLNDSGTTDDRFAILVTALSGDGDDQAVAFIDTDLDRSFFDEQPLSNYRLNYDTFTLQRQRPEKQIVPVAFAINIFLRQLKVVVHYDDGAHGTHVAGIAAGYRINNQDGFNGIAPGAKLMSLKIGQNAIGGVSTTESIKKAVEYAGRYAREHAVPVVCNLSFGVESEIEGDSDIDKFIDEYMRKNPYLLFVTSAGNAGPGLSSVGTPAAAAEAFSIGAMLAADTARDVMGFEISEPIVTVFSSRGGEVDKPDIATPGWSTSTVPRWVRDGDYWAGTSMASPYAAGLCALLISDAAVRHPGQQARAWDIRRALALTAKPVAGAEVPDVGWGLPDLPTAADLLNELMQAARNDPIIGYEISTPCAHGHGGTAPVAYWRSTWFPRDERQTFTVKPVFMPGTDASARTSFTRKYALRAASPWIKLPQREVYLRSEQSASVHVEYDASKLTEPGLYSGAVEAVADGHVAFRLLNTIVVPHRVPAEQGGGAAMGAGTKDAIRPSAAAEPFTLRFRDRTVHGWDPDRVFVSVPRGASAMKVTLSAPAGRESKASIERIYDPNGAQHRKRANQLDTYDGKREVVWSVVEELLPGVWELPVVADRPDKKWPYDLTVHFFGLEPEPARITEWSGSPAEGEFIVTNIFDRPLAAAGKGELEGFRLVEEGEFKGLEDELTYSLTLDESYDRVRIDLEMTKEAYATTTDIGVAVEVGGKEIYSSAFGDRFHKATVNVPDVGEETEVKLIIRGGFAVADDKRETPITVRFDQLLAEPVAIEVKHGEAEDIRFVPGVPIKIGFALESAAPPAPEDVGPVGYIAFEERSSKDTVLRIPVEIAP